MKVCILLCLLSSFFASLALGAGIPFSCPGYNLDAGVTATSTFSGTFDPSTMFLTWSITHNYVDAQLIHIHGPVQTAWANSAANPFLQSASPLVNIATTPAVAAASPVTGSMTVTMPTHIAICDNKTYFNLHGTGSYGGGAIACAIVIDCNAVVAEEPSPAAAMPSPPSPLAKSPTPTSIGTIPNPPPPPTPTRVVSRCLVGSQNNGFGVVLQQDCSSADGFCMLTWQKTSYVSQYVFSCGSSNCVVVNAGIEGTCCCEGDLCNRAGSCGPSTGLSSRIKSIGIIASVLLGLGIVL
jgi:hypothetical protein